MQISSFLLLISTIACGVATLTGQSEFQLGFWNVENLFDTTNAASINDVDFTPLGRYEWTETRLQKKMNDLSKVIHDMDQENDLALLGLAEIENYKILNRLNTDFVGSGYEIVHKESPDERGIDCALIFKPAILELVNHHFITVFLAGTEKTRDIIEAEFKPVNAAGRSSLFVFVNHWPSRWGGQEQTDPLRRSAAFTLRTRIDQILMSKPKADIIVMGDFNDYPNDPSLIEVLRAAAFRIDPYPGDLINTTWELNEDPTAGTCMYKGSWVVLDQIIISYGMMDKTDYSWVSGSSKPFHKDYLIESKGEYAGWPFRMFRGGQYQGGYSDHLPIICRVVFSEY
ncbi:endonuclease/exonuclease/phosphatase family protein [bacterium]|nr:endonuclease/exonuclease/phosphatase family protein [bacterium]